MSLISPSPERTPQLILVNLGARQARKSLLELRAIASAVGAPLVSFRELQEIRTRLEEVPEDSLIWVAGGDGTLSRLAETFLRRKLTLGILPLGTGNTLARELEVPLRLDLAVNQHLTQSKLRRIDVGLLEERPFLNAVSLGLSTGIANALKSLPKHRFGNWVYLPGVFMALRATKPFHVKIDAEGDGFEGEIVQFVAASTRNHGGPFAVSPTAAIDDGLLSVYAVEPKGKGTMLRYALGLILGRQTDLGEVWTCETKSVGLKLNLRRRFVVDGELTEKRLAARVGICPSALSVLS